MDPNWRHIIPPGQERVISQGHCMEDCTGSAFPPKGINIFAVMMRTHQIGREIKLRQVRQSPFSLLYASVYLCRNLINQQLAMVLSAVRVLLANGAPQIKHNYKDTSLAPCVRPRLIFIKFSIPLYCSLSVLSSQID